LTSLAPPPLKLSGKSSSVSSSSYCSCCLTDSPRVSSSSRYCSASS
jgi:hypothetical protein